MPMTFIGLEVGTLTWCANERYSSKTIISGGNQEFPECEHELKVIIENTGDKLTMTTCVSRSHCILSRPSSFCLLMSHNGITNEISVQMMKKCKFVMDHQAREKGHLHTMRYDNWQLVKVGCAYV